MLITNEEDFTSIQSEQCVKAANITAPIRHERPPK